MEHHNLELAAILEAAADPAIHWVYVTSTWACDILYIACLIPCILRVWRSGKIRAGIIPGWIGLASWVIVTVFVLRFIAEWITDDRRVVLFFSGGPPAGATLILGWVISFVISLLVFTVREVYLTILRWCGRGTDRKA